VINNNINREPACDEHGKRAASKGKLTN